MEQKNIENMFMEYKSTAKDSTYCAGDHALHAIVAEWQRHQIHV